MDLDVFERDCEQACYRYLEVYKQRISEEGWPDISVEDAIRNPHILTYLHYSYRVSGYNERVQADSILARWNARASHELRDYWDTYKRHRDEKKRREAQVKAEKEEREKERERERRIQQREREEEEEREREEMRRRQEEERKREEAKREEQDKQNREKLSKIQEEWKRRHHITEEPSQPLEELSYCTSCGAPNAKSAKFCTKCGTQLQMKCPSCGALFRVGAKFCTQCGSKVDG
jgi:ribosomal protein L40E